eukprot:2712591-Rhodomonas_salina.1
MSGRQKAKEITAHVRPQESKHKTSPPMSGAESRYTSPPMSEAEEGNATRLLPHTHTLHVRPQKTMQHRPCQALTSACPRITPPIPGRMG